LSPARPSPTPPAAGCSRTCRYRSSAARTAACCAASQAAFPPLFATSSNNSATQFQRSPPRSTPPISRSPPRSHRTNCFPVAAAVKGTHRLHSTRLSPVHPHQTAPLAGHRQHNSQSSRLDAGSSHFEVGVARSLRLPDSLLRPSHFSILPRACCLARFAISLMCVTGRQYTSPHHPE